ncbi:SRPBCC family protein [Mycobacterium celatum]|uniref:MxaD family protein n=1 Tax=Mycobacterium celatum TaxID=28045 RepID=A0A2G5PP67_MYCCE|nr:SRPBCC family protein [Mycobacterium celatum]PIB79734.1 MxaD family protein [Mycobacterium celatum]
MRFDAIPITAERADEFFETAPFVTYIQRSFAAPPEHVWGVIAGSRMWSWLPTVWGCRYPVATEPAAGVVRDFQMHVHKWLVFAQHEQLIEFDTTRMMMRYTAIDATLPVFGSWCEEYRVEPADNPEHATVKWTLACAPRYLRRIPGVRFALRPTAAVLQPIFRIGLGGLERELPSHAPPQLTAGIPLGLNSKDHI